MVAVPSPFELMNAVGLLAFAVVGSLKGVESDLDVLGVTVVGVLTALGGGTTRDVLVGRTPGALTAEADVLIALSGVAIGIGLARFGRTDLSASPLVTVPDAAGLAAFAATGAIVGTDAALSPFGVVTLAALTGVGGSIIRDVLLQEVPVVLHEDFYATCAVLGGVTFWGLSAAGVGRPFPTVGCVLVVLSTRLLALSRDWSLPTVDARGSR